MNSSLNSSASCSCLRTSAGVGAFLPQQKAMAKRSPSGYFYLIALSCISGILDSAIGPISVDLAFAARAAFGRLFALAALFGRTGTGC